MNKLFILSVFALSLIVLSFRFATVSTPDDWDIPAKYLDMENPYEATADALDIGKDLYNQHCKSCHGKTGEGDGPKAEELDTDCGDFTTEEFQSQSDGVLYYKSIIGRDDMPEFDKKIPDEEDRWALISYVQTM